MGQNNLNHIRPTETTMPKPSAHRAYLALFDGKNENKDKGDAKFMGEPWYLYIKGDTLLYRENKDGTISMRCRDTRARVDNMPDKAEAYKAVRQIQQQILYKRNCPWAK